MSKYSGAYGTERSEIKEGAWRQNVIALGIVAEILLQKQKIATESPTHRGMPIFYFKNYDILHFGKSIVREVHFGSVLKKEKMEIKK